MCRVPGGKRSLRFAGANFGPGCLSFRRETDVIGVGVRQDDRLDIVPFHAERSQAGLKLSEFLGGAGIDDRRLSSLGQKVEIVVARSEPIDAVCDLSHTVLPRRAYLKYNA